MAIPQMESVTSSNIKAIGYDAAENKLYVEFYSKSGRSLYVYYDVPEAIYNSLINAGSHGEYFHRNIKNVYSFDKI